MDREPVQVCLSLSCSHGNGSCGPPFLSARGSADAASGASAAPIAGDGLAGQGAGLAWPPRVRRAQPSRADLAGNYGRLPRPARRWPARALAVTAPVLSPRWASLGVRDPRGTRDRRLMSALGLWATSCVAPPALFEQRGKRKRGDPDNGRGFGNLRIGFVDVDVYAYGTPIFDERGDV